MSLTTQQRKYLERFKNGAYAWHATGMTSLCMSDDGYIRQEIADAMLKAKVVRWSSGKIIYAAPGEVDSLAETERKEEEHRRHQQDEETKANKAFWVKAIRYAGKHMTDEGIVKLLQTVMLGGLSARPLAVVCCGSTRPTAAPASVSTEEESSSSPHQSSGDSAERRTVSY